MAVVSHVIIALVSLIRNVELLHKPLERKEFISFQLLDSACEVSLSFLLLPVGNNMRNQCLEKNMYYISQSPHDLNLLVCMNRQSKVTITEQCDVHSTSFQSCGQRKNIRGIFPNSLTHKPGHWPGEKD